MHGLLEQKYKEIFEVKIKQERLCQLLQSFNIKIHNLEESHKAIQNTMSMSNILDEVKKYVKNLVKEESTQMIYKFYEKIQTCNKDVNRIEYSYKNFEKNMRSQFQSLNQKQKLLEKTVSYMNSHEILKLRSELSGINTQIILSKTQMMKQIATDRQKITEVGQKCDKFSQLLENGEQKLENFQEIISTFEKKIYELRHPEAAVKVENEKEKEKQKQRLAPPQIIKKSRISARRTIDNTLFQRSYDQIKEVAESKDSKDLKQGKEIKETKERREGKQNDLLTINKKLDNLQRRVSGIIDSNPNIPTAQNIQNQRDSLISTQQLMHLSKFDSAQNMDRNMNKSSSMKRNSSNFKRGSIRTEQNRESCVQDYGRSYFAANNATNQIRKINERLTSIHFKYTLLEQNYEVLLSKINKLGSLEATIQTKIDEAEKLRVDVNTINEIKLRFKQIQASMELQQIRYVNHTTYQKETDGINKRINAIDALLPLFARKEEVVSAFTFVENKIKEIVIVLSNKFEQEKMGAVNKIQHIRCLTCDKEANLTDLPRPNTRVNIRNSQNSHLSYHKSEAMKRFRTEQIE